MDKAYVINLKHRTDRWEQIQKDFEGVPLILERADALILDDNTLTQKQKGYNAVAYKHIQLVTEARARGDKTILIFEDDCLLEPDSWNNWVKIKKYLDNNLEDWEVFNGGLMGLGDIHKIVKLEHIHLIKETGGACCHFFYINVNASYEKILNWVVDKQEIDLYYSMNFNYWASYPLLAIQRNGKSDVLEVDKDWNFYFTATKSECIRKIGNFRFNKNFITK
jgi:hypothetical protein